MIEMTILKIGSNNCIPVKCISKTAKMTPTEFNRSPTKCHNALCTLIFCSFFKNALI